MRDMLFPVLQLVLVIVIGFIEHEQEHEHDYDDGIDRRDAIRKVAPPQQPTL
jgi:hypothetical protein